jgi:hypothetical protein
MIKILSCISFYSIEELPFVSLNERKRNVVTIARNVHSADNSSIEPGARKYELPIVYLFLNVLGLFCSA